jgi:hypothetical protein
MNITKHLPGLTNEQIRSLQERILSRAYACYNEKPARRAIRNAQYDETVAELIKRLTAEAPVYEIDADLGQMFSDCFKEECGCRPGVWSYQMAKDYMDARYKKG